MSPTPRPPATQTPTPRPPATQTPTPRPPATQTPTPRPPASVDQLLAGIHERPLEEQVGRYERIHAELVAKLQGSEG